MANVKRWSLTRMAIVYGKGVCDQFSVDTAVMDSDVQCMHCGKNIKAGKLVFCSSHWIFNPFERGDNYWG